MALALSTQYNIPGSQTFATLLTNQAASGVPVGTQAVTTDQGVVYSNGTVWLPLGRCAVLAQCGIPFIIPPSGSISAPGALSGITLDQTYANCYMHFPANAVAASSAAGWYYVAMSSTTAGTVYLNTYTSGQPVVPAVLTPVVAGQTSYTQGTSLVAGPVVSVPANMMGPNGELEVDYATNGTSSTNNKTFALMIGASTTMQTTLTATTAAADAGALCRVRNGGVTNIQYGLTTKTGDPATTTTAGITLGAIDTTAAWNVTLNMTLATATEFMMIYSFSIKVYPN